MEEMDWRQLRGEALAAARAQGAAEWAEDIADEALTRLWVNLESVDNAHAWVRQVARRLTIDRHRAQPAGGWGEMPVTAPGPGQQAWPEELLVRSHSSKVAARADLERVLTVVNDVERDLLLGQAQGYSTRELAERHDYTERSVRTKLSVARRKIREAFPDLAAVLVS